MVRANGIGVKFASAGPRSGYVLRATIDERQRYRSPAHLRGARIFYLQGIIIRIAAARVRGIEGAFAFAVPLSDCVLRAWIHEQQRYEFPRSQGARGDELRGITAQIVVAADQGNGVKSVLE